MLTLKGHLLVAAPALLDPNFAQTVLLLVQHDENGAAGLVLNRPLEMSIADAWEQVSALPCQSEAPLFRGGPCADTLGVLHEHADSGQIEVLPGVFLTTDAPSIESLVVTGTEPRKFFVGYAGWTGGQLENELIEKAWLVVPATRADIFDTPEDIWVKLLQKLARSPLRPNVDPRSVPPDPSLN